MLMQDAQYLLASGRPPWLTQGRLLADAERSTPFPLRLFKAEQPTFRMEVRPDRFVPT